MTNASGTGVLLQHTFDDSSSFRVRLSDLFSEEVRLLLERLQTSKAGSSASASHDRNMKMSESRGVQRLWAKMEIKPGESKPE